jgi:hypothetical protein
MFDKSIIKTAATGLVGFNYSTHQFYKYLTTDYKSSSSNYWINSFQGADMATIEASQPSEIRDVDLIVGERYKIRATGGDFTNVGSADNNVGTVFVADDTTPTTWANAYLELQSANKYIETILAEEIINLATKFISNSKSYLKQNTLLSNHSVIGGVADVEKTITKQGRFVGFVLNPHEGNNIVNTITKVGFLGDANDSGLKLYLFETSQEDAIATFEFDYSTGLSQQWKDISDFIIKYDNISSGGGVGQKYLLGYFEDELTCNAVEMEFNQSLKNFSIFGKYMGVFPFAIPSAKLNGAKLPSDILNLGNYISENTHGIYFKFTSNCDYTNLIKDNIDMFAEPLQYAVAIRILQDAVSSVGVHNSTKDSAIIEWRKLISRYSGTLNGGNRQYGDVIKYEKGLIQLLTLDFSNIDAVCFKKDPNDWRIGNLM